MSLVQTLQGQTAIITGGANGLGFALAQRLARHEVTVAIFDCKEERLFHAQEFLGPACHIYAVDVTDKAGVDESVDALLSVTGRIDILVNAAGIVGKTNIKSHEVDLTDFDRVMEVNVKGSLITAQAVLPSMLDRNYGRILHVASISGKEGNAGMLAY